MVFMNSKQMWQGNSAPESTKIYFSYRKVFFKAKHNLCFRSVFSMSLFTFFYRRCRRLRLSEISTISIETFFSTYLNESSTSLLLYSLFLV